MVKLKSIAAGVAAAGLIAAAPVAAVLAQSSNGRSNPGDNIKICHATGSATNPYVTNSPNVNGIVSGHYPHQDNRDIIPPFDYNDKGTKHFPGQNWTASGQAIYNNGCKPTTPGGGGGGGGGGGITPSGGQVLGATGQSQFSQVPVGSANGGGGGISDFSLTSLARDW